MSSSPQPDEYPNDVPTGHARVVVRVEWLPAWFLKLLAGGFVLLLLIVLDWYART